MNGFLGAPISRNTARQISASTENALPIEKAFLFMFDVVPLHGCACSSAAFLFPFAIFHPYLDFWVWVRLQREHEFSHFLECVTCALPDLCASLDDSYVLQLPELLKVAFVVDHVVVAVTPDDGLQGLKQTRDFG
jgi:hypothetical protein